MKTYIINGDNFSNLDGFYDEVQKVLTDNFTGFGRNFDAFVDILRGGFGRFDYGEPIELIWMNFDKSKKDLAAAKKQSGPTFYEIIIDIIQNNKKVNLILK
jgi:RNAse (barnase) inhibitor barstar